MQGSLSIQRRVRVGQQYIDVRTSLLAKPARHIIFIHGIGVSGRYFLPFALECAQEFNVHVIDMPGYGKTPKPKEPLSLEEMADVAAQYVRNVGLNNVIIVGQSMGCQTAIQIGMRHADISARFILIAPTVNRSERNVFIQGLRLLQDTFHEPLRANIIILGDYIRMGLVRYLKTIRFMLNDQIEKSIKAVDADILIVRGAKDPIVPKEWTDYLARQSRRSVVVEIPKAAHVVQFTRAKELFDACRSFLAN